MKEFKKDKNKKSRLGSCGRGRQGKRMTCMNLGRAGGSNGAFPRALPVEGRKEEEEEEEGHGFFAFLEQQLLGMEKSNGKVAVVGISLSQFWYYVCNLYSVCVDICNSKVLHLGPEQKPTTVLTGRPVPPPPPKISRKEKRCSSLVALWNSPAVFEDKAGKQKRAWTIYFCFGFILPIDFRDPFSLRNNTANNGAYIHAGQDKAERGSTFRSKTPFRTHGWGKGADADLTCHAPLPLFFFFFCIFIFI